MFSLIEIIETEQWRKDKRRIYWPLNKALDKFDCESELSDQSINNLVNLLLSISAQTDNKVWLSACWRLLKNVDRYFLGEHKQYADGTIENLFVLSKEAIKKDNNFPLDFVYKHSMQIANRARENCYRVSETHMNFILQMMCTDLVNLVMTLDIMQICKQLREREVMHICESADMLLRIMHREGVKLSGSLIEKPQAVLSLCHTMHMYSQTNRRYVLFELKDLVRNIKTGLSLELYRELNEVAEKYNHRDLKKTLRQM